MTEIVQAKTEAAWVRRDRLKAAAAREARPFTNAEVITGLTKLLQSERERSAASIKAVRDELQEKIGALTEMQRELDGLKSQLSDLSTAIKHVGAHAPDALYASVTVERLKALKAGMSSYAVSFLRQRASLDGPAGKALSTAINGDQHV
ncbi:hypothetical protein [Paracoccus sp. KR1-242]|uniref:hypothetical protein n=1 Tax=Paracoccus sp. KR1-242 TaxID=3410028 RepID=UPI003C030179